MLYDWGLGYVVQELDRFQQLALRQRSFAERGPHWSPVTGMSREAAFS